MENKIYKYTLSSVASKDIEETLNYISDKLSNPSAAGNLFVHIKDAITQICTFPLAQSTCENYLIQNKNFRKIFIDNYVLIYEIIEEEKTISILRFKYARMDLENINL